MKPTISGLLLAMPLALALFAGPSSATDLFDTNDTCTTLNCNAITLRGTYNSYVTQNSVRAPEYSLKVWAQGGTCLRLDVVSQDHDLEMTVVSPNPSIVFRNDDRAGEVGACGATCPLLKISGTQPGWYTVVLHHFAGAVIDGNVALTYGQYNVGNTTNCVNPTPPILSLRESKKKTGETAVGNPDE